MGNMERILCPGGPHRVLLSFNPPFSLISLNLEGNKCWTRKGIPFWIEKLIVNSAEGLGFRGTQFRAQADFSHGKAGFFDHEKLSFLRHDFSKRGFYFGLAVV